MHNTNISPIYTIKDNSVYVLDNFLNYKKYDNLDLNIYNKYMQYYQNNNNILTKQLPIANCNIRNVYFLYPYSIWYGYPKTNISQLLEIAKLWNEKYCQYVYNNYIKDIIPNIANNYDAIAFVPPSISRKCNILNLMKKQIKLIWKPIIYTYKKNIWPQIKTVKKLEDKIKTADEKFAVWKVDNNIQSILIIDDVVNTWASICSIAKKIKEKNENVIIDSFCLIWSLDNQMIKEI